MLGIVKQKLQLQIYLQHLFNLYCFRVVFLDLLFFN